MFTGSFIQCHSITLPKLITVFSSCLGFLFTANLISLVRFYCSQPSCSFNIRSDTDCKEMNNGRTKQIGTEGSHVTAKCKRNTCSIKHTVYSLCVVGAQLPPALPWSGNMNLFLGEWHFPIVKHSKSWDLIWFKSWVRFGLGLWTSLQLQNTLYYAESLPFFRPPLQYHRGWGLCFALCLWCLTQQGPDPNRSLCAEVYTS